MCLKRTLRLPLSTSGLKATLAGHADIVRKVLYNPKASCLLSCSNDQAIKMWSVDGLEMQSLGGHDGFVFDILLGSSGDFSNLMYSAADDRTVSSCEFFVFHFVATPSLLLD